MRENKRPNPKRNFKLIWGAVMVILYLAFAYALIFTSLFQSSVIPKGIRVILGVIFAAYAVMRGYRIKKELENV